MRRPVGQDRPGACSQLREGGWRGLRPGCKRTFPTWTCRDWAGEGDGLYAHLGVLRDGRRTFEREQPRLGRRILEGKSSKMMARWIIKSARLEEMPPSSSCAHRLVAESGVSLSAPPASEASSCGSVHSRCGGLQSSAVRTSSLLVDRTRIASRETESVR